jgi:hypothetical protein
MCDLENTRTLLGGSSSVSILQEKPCLTICPVEVSINKWGEELYTDRSTITFGQEDNAKIETNELDVGYWP